MVFSIDTTGFVPVNMSKKPIIYIDRFKYLGEDVLKQMKKFINQKYYDSKLSENKEFYSKTFD